MKKKAKIEIENEIDILRAHAIAAALHRAKPSTTDHPDAMDAWLDAVRQVAAVVCTSDGVSLVQFHRLCGDRE